mmetsp:Transcript_99067/g.196396  ORF Transcript_99067/g.196396 Transcript_99067/m.196396 type:complete len:100 (+) Transcript_99067:219-518(+)
MLRGNVVVCCPEALLASVLASNGDHAGPDQKDLVLPGVCLEEVVFNTVDPVGAVELDFIVAMGVAEAAVVDPSGIAAEVASSGLVVLTAPVRVTGTTRF